MSYEQRIYNTAVSDGMPTDLAKLIVAQTKLETGNYTHRFFTEGNNAIGYSFVWPYGSKWQLPFPGDLADNNISIGQYATIENSIHELTDWIKRRQKEGKFPSSLSQITTPAQYATLLKNAGYYGASLNDYTNGLATWLMKLPALSIGIGSLILTVAIGYFITRK